MQQRNPGEGLIENAQLLFRNFNGVVSPMNQRGDREFSVILPDELADQLTADGWNVRKLKDREGDDGEVIEGPRILGIKCGYAEGTRPPQVVMITSRGRTFLTENEIGLLDDADILVADLSFRAHHYDINGRKGIKAYLKALYVTIQEDYLMEKYGTVPAARQAGHVEEYEEDGA